MGNGKGFGKRSKGGGKGGKGGGKGARAAAAARRGPTGRATTQIRTSSGIRSGCNGILPRSLPRKPPGSRGQEPNNGSRGLASNCMLQQSALQAGWMSRVRC